MKQTLCGFALVGLLGCGTAPAPPPTFLLQYPPRVSTQSVGVLPVSFGVARVQASTTYARRSVMWREGAQLGYYTTGAWSDIPQTLVGDSLVQYAREYGGFAEVRRVSSGFGAPADIVARPRIVAFEANIASGVREAHVAVHLVLTGSSGEYVFWEGVLEHAEPVQGQGMEPLLRAFGVAQHAVNDQAVAITRSVIEDGHFDRSLNHG